MFRVHRLVCAAFHGAPPTQDHEAAHINGNRRDNRAENIYWATRIQNEADKLRHGTRAMGERVGTSKLTLDQVKKIKRWLATGDTYQAIADRVGGITKHAIFRIAKGTNWAWVK